MVEHIIQAFIDAVFIMGLGCLGAAAVLQLYVWWMEARGGRARRGN